MNNTNFKQLSFKIIKHQFIKKYFVETAFKQNVYKYIILKLKLILFSFLFSYKLEKKILIVTFLNVHTIKQVFNIKIILQLHIKRNQDQDFKN